VSRSFPGNFCGGKDRYKGEEMNFKHYIWINVIGLVLILTFCLTGDIKAETEDSPTLTQWEYTVMFSLTQANSVGHWGWELVSVLPGLDGDPTYFYLKRPLRNGKSWYDSDE